MKSEPDSSPIWEAWANGKALVGPNKPHSRITVQPGWWLNTTDHAGDRPPAKLPIRYFQRADNSQQEIEIPGVRSIDVDYDVDQDVATLSVQLVNNLFDPDYGSSEWQNSNGDFGRPGYLTSDRGSVSNRWGYVPNEWSGLLVRNSLLRSYEGYGGQDKTLEQAIADGNLVLTGIWLVDDVPIKTGQGFELQARNTGKLLVDQYLYPPLIPAGDYPMSRARFFYSSTSLTTAQVIYGTNGLPNSKFRILRIERSLAGGYWLVGTDGGIFTYGPAHFQGSIDSIGLTITPGVYPSEGVTGISRSHTGDGYWLTTDTGAVYSFGDAQFHGGAGLSDPPTHPVIAIETAGTRDGYWLIGDDGGVFSFGDVDFYGSLPPLVAGAKIVDGASTPDGLGYWLVDNFGHTYSYGNANYFGGITGALSAPIVAIASSPTGNGYVMTGKDGGVFAFGDAGFYGSVPGLSPPIVLNDPVCDIVLTESGHGYWLAAEDGGVFAFGDAVFYGSLPQPDTITTTTTTDGNYLDILDIVKDIFLYAGFNLYDGGATDDVYGVLETTGIYVPDEGGNVLDATFFDKLPCQDPLTKLKEIVGYVMYVGDEGEIHFHCVDDETEILTPFGWRRHDDLAAGDFCLALDPTTGQSYWEVVDHVNEYEVDDVEMVSMEAQGHSSLTTPNHRWWVRHWRGRPRRGEMEWRRSDELNAEMSIPIAAPFASPVLPTYSDELVELAAWWITEGSYQWNGGSIYQSQRANPRKVERIERAFRTLYGQPGPLRHGPPTLSDAEGDEAIAMVKDGCAQKEVAQKFGIDRHTLSKWVRHGRPRSGRWHVKPHKHAGMLFFRFDAGVMAQLERICPNKAASVDFLCLLTASQLQRFVEVCCLGDGNKYNVKGYGYSRFTQNPGPTSDSVQLACILAGIAPGKIGAPPSGYVSSLPTITTESKAERFQLRTSRWASPVAAAAARNGAARVGRIRYTGTVWCPTLKASNIWLARRRGTVYFTGNSPNFWESGNFLPDHSHTATVPVVDERVQLTSYQVNTPDKDLRSEIIISSEDPDLGIAGTVTTSFTPSTARELRGLVRPAMWVNEAFVDSATQQTMAELIALHIYFKSRLGTVACMGNPCLQVDDQVQILERETFEINTHYVRRIHRTHDRKAGTYSMQLTTNVLSPPGSWAVVKPTGTPEGSIVVRRP